MMGKAMPDEKDLPSDKTEEHPDAITNEDLVSIIINKYKRPCLDNELHASIGSSNRIEPSNKATSTGIRSIPSSVDVVMGRGLY